MSSRKNGGGGTGHEGGHDHIIEVTPEGGFDIRKVARRLSRLMEDLQQPLIIHLSHVSVEFEIGCTPKEIVDGYNYALNTQMAGRSSNTNVKPPKKK